MNPNLTHLMLLMSPIPAIPAANQAAVQVTGLQDASETFNTDNIMIMEGVDYAVAGTYITTEQYGELESFATDLGGAYYVLKQKDSNGDWHTVNKMADLMSEHNIERPQLERPQLDDPL